MNMHVDPVQPGTTVSWLHSTYKVLLTPQYSDGNLGIFECVGAPNAGPPRHVHHDGDETFYILQGEVLFWLDGRTMTKGPGQVVFVPRGKEHTYHVVGPEPARFVVIMTPGGFESFFPAMASGGYRIPEDMPAVTRIAANYSLEFTGPPLKV